MAALSGHGFGGVPRSKSVSQRRRSGVDVDAVVVEFVVSCIVAGPVDLAQSWRLAFSALEYALLKIRIASTDSSHLSTPQLTDSQAPD